MRTFCVKKRNPRVKKKPETITTAGYDRGSNFKRITKSQGKRTPGVHIFVYVYISYTLFFILQKSLGCVSSAAVVVLNKKTRVRIENRNPSARSRGGRLQRPNWILHSYTFSTLLSEQSDKTNAQVVQKKIRSLYRLPFFTYLPKQNGFYFNNVGAQNN